MACGTSEKMPIDVSANDEKSAQNGQSRVASPTVGPRSAAACDRCNPGAPRSIRAHGRNNSSGMKTALTAAKTM